MDYNKLESVLISAGCIIYGTYIAQRLVGQPGEIMFCAPIEGMEDIDNIVSKLSNSYSVEVDRFISTNRFLIKATDKNNSTVCILLSEYEDRLMFNISNLKNYQGNIGILKRSNAYDLPTLLRRVYNKEFFINKLHESERGIYIDVLKAEATQLIQSGWKLLQPTSELELENFEDISILA
jgi:hypothetical protein